MAGFPYGEALVVVWVLFVSGFLAAPITWFGPFAGARVGCVVRGCCLRTT